MKQRILALALTVAMLLSLFPGQVFATQTRVEHTEHSYTEVQPQQSTQSTEAEEIPAATQPYKGAQTSADAFVQSLDYDAAIEDLTYLTKEIGIRVTASENEYRAQDYVAGVFADLGYEVTRQDVSTRNGTAQNVIGMKRAAVQTQRTIYVTAHIDTVSPSPGASDNGSGVVGMLAIARALKDVETN